jgi:hypothetical protein
MGLSVIQTGPEADRNGPRKLEIVKTNLAAYPEALGVEFVPLHPTGVYLKWLKEAPEQYEAPTKADDCQEWLLRYMREAGEPVKPADVVEAAAEAGYSRKTLYRARTALDGQIVNTEGRKHPANYWKLKDELDGSEEPAEEEE